MQIGSKPEGARFYVDGQLYQQTTTFTWPVGSKHIVEFPVYIRPEDNAPQTYQLSLRRTMLRRRTSSAWT